MVRLCFNFVVFVARRVLERRRLKVVLDLREEVPVELCLTRSM